MGQISLVKNSPTSLFSLKNWNYIDFDILVVGLTPSNSKIQLSFYQRGQIFFNQVASTLLLTVILSGALFLDFLATSKSGSAFSLSSSLLDFPVSMILLCFKSFCLVTLSQYLREKKIFLNPAYKWLLSLIIYINKLLSFTSIKDNQLDKIQFPISTWLCIEKSVQYMEKTEHTENKLTDLCEKPWCIRQTTLYCIYSSKNNAINKTLRYSILHIHIHTSVKNALFPFFQGVVTEFLYHHY